ncbi:EAL domain-containing protein [Paucibacter sediminis]|uniref:EAL domain-containing protein n=1 Tax=Paucibacter sediminis TaxID=3019553 RepID=A0AA95SRJ3_9BURK|nr:EAL domain-containing protein [Paucibacter sp. S2-9]WIT13251.1 EAL domain-containing protein [Paucibacter sp. S2-9]
MDSLILISSCLDVLMGAAMLVLWRIDRRYVYVRLWGWSAVLLGTGLALGVALVPVEMQGPRADIQALAASLAVTSSLYLLMAGAHAYRGLPWPHRRWAAALGLAMLLIAGLSRVQLSHAVIAAAIVLAVGNWLCAGWIGLGAGGSGERVVGLILLASGTVHAIGPLLDPLSRSPITHALGLLVQTLLCLGLILLSVARAHREVREQADRFSRLAEHSLQGLAVLRGGRLLYANRAALAIFGYAELGQAQRADLHRELVPPDLQPAAEQRHAQVMARADARVEWEGPRLSHDGRSLYVRGLSSQIEWDGAPAELQALIDDTARQHAIQALRRQALHDELTGLPNRNFAVEQLQRLTARSDPFALISADVDRFQLINETLGHELGDELLRALGERLCRELPAQAMLARLGEDQFIVLLEGMADAAGAQREVERMLALLEQPFSVGGQVLFVHLSAGVALYPQDGRDAPSLLRAADSAMHRAKALPGNSYVFFDKGMNRAARARLQAEQALAQAIQAGEILLEYQPKFRAGTRRLCGFEALARWQRPDGTRVSPAEFVPAAERTGQIKGLGELILQTAVAQLRDWHARYAAVPTVAVNVSPLQFEDADFAQQVLRMLDQAGLPHAAIEIEITETAAIGHLGHVLPQLERLKRAGVLCSLDDFGTGQSSLTMLRKLPISTMKLDRSMVEPLPRADAAAVLRATCALGHSLGLEIVAEGVETEDQAQALEALGCTQLQGFHLGRPLSAAAAGELLAQARS